MNIEINSCVGQEIIKKYPEAFILITSSEIVDGKEKISPFTTVHINTEKLEAIINETAMDIIDFTELGRFIAEIKRTGTDKLILWNKDFLINKVSEQVSKFACLDLGSLKPIEVSVPTLLAKEK